MAKKPKSSQSDTVKDDAVIENPATESPEADAMVDGPDVVEDAVVVEDDVVEDAPDLTDDKSDAAEIVADEPEVVEAPVVEDPAPVAVVPTPDHASNSVFLPAILGGLIAAGIGFAVAYYILPRADTALPGEIAQNAAAVSALEAQIAALPAPVDIGPLNAEIGALEAQATEAFGDFSSRIAALEGRIDTVERQPSADGTLTATALAAYQADLDALKSQLSEQADATMSQLAQTREEALAIEKAAADAARNAKVRTALAQVQTALETGAPMGSALTDLGSAYGSDLPEDLIAVTDGTPTLASLQASFPDAARQALGDARSQGASGETAGGFGSFLREQLNVRSVAPRDGTDADAVLSRAEAALKEGRLNDTLAEVATLPEVARPAVSEWAAAAELRANAIAAVDEISLSLTDN